MFGFYTMIQISVFFAIVIPVLSAGVSQNASVTWDSGAGIFTVHRFKADKYVAYATFTDEIFLTGWSYLEVSTNEKYPDSVQAYAAGLVEGVLTADLIKKNWNNQGKMYCKGETSYCQRLKNFLQINLDFINFNIAKSRKYVPYWHQVALVLEQLSGLEDGYKNISGSPRTQIDVMDLMLLNIFGDLEDLEAILNRTVTRHPLGSGSCSALIKVLPNNKDLYVAQDTWSSYNTMLRTLKKYNISVHTGMQRGSPVVPGRAVAFSSQPGLIFSGDDFYLISSGLAAVETTVGNNNVSLWKYIKAKGAVLEWIRNIVSNRLAKDGEEWTKVFELYNSGTYNNQWMVVNYKKFITGEPLQDGLLWVLEQIPGYIHSEDVTNILRKQNYWPSYNVPYFQDIFNLSGGQINVEKYGDWFTYDKTPRALIFKRDEVNVHDIPSMIKLMRYNDYTNDPLSRCNCTPPYSAENAISARCDLNPANGTYPIAALGHRPHGATDMKLTTSSLYQKLQFVAFGGPTYDPLPPFQWSKTDFGKTMPHEGHPDLWKFEPIVHKWQKK
uniref:Phospholipase B-like n=2 Tax=Liphistius sp. SGP-2016 TaxID=1905180 RepID=A0A4Q8K3A3_9ARAC